MSKPVILAIDDDVSVLEAVVQDLRRRYAANYRILRASSGQAALDLAKQLKQRSESVALFLSDQRMPGMNGTELLERSIDVFPDARRALLTAYSDTEAAIRAINAARIHYYLTKPWDPPEEKLYPVVDDLIEAWRDSHKPPFEGLRVVGARYTLRDHEVRQFLTGNRIPYVWLDVESSPEAQQLLSQNSLNEAKLPVVFFPDGSYLEHPEPIRIAEKVGMRTQPSSDVYDLVVLGAGLAGLAAGVYGASEGLRTLLIEQEAPGGQAGTSSMIRNYLGFPQGVSGALLAERAYQQAVGFQVEFLAGRAASIRTDQGYHFICLGDGKEISAQTCLIATGVAWRRLNVPGVEQLTGAGVYYGAALTEARSCKDEEVFIVGGANSAGQAALAFSQYARRVVMLVRAASLESSMSKYLIDEIARESNIEVWNGSQVVEAVGNGRLQQLRVLRPDGEQTVDASGLFIFIGAEPKTDWLPPSVLKDDRGFVFSGNDLKRCPQFPKQWQLGRDPYLLETSVPGLFAAGDVRHGSIKRAASAVGEGSIAVQFIHQYMAGR
ncbi:MAG TPA: FAD-dependent oxidoreductase [Acidobacteriaceae bacterium]